MVFAGSRWQKIVKLRAALRRPFKPCSRVPIALQCDALLSPVLGGELVRPLPAPKSLCSPASMVPIWAVPNIMLIYVVWSSLKDVIVFHYSNQPTSKVNRSSRLNKTRPIDVQKILYVCSWQYKIHCACKTSHNPMCALFEKKQSQLHQKHPGPRFVMT